MFLSVLHFAGEPKALAAAHARMLESIPLANLSLHAAVPHAGGLDVYDACPTREVAEAFSASEGFRGLLKACGLPEPSIERIGDIAALVTSGRRVA